MGELKRKFWSWERKIDMAIDEELDTEEECPGNRKFLENSWEWASAVWNRGQTFRGGLQLYVLLSCLTQLHQTVRKATRPLLTALSIPEVNVKDHLKRSLLHVAVEQGLESFAKCLADMGLEVNSREGCGITPLSLAVWHKNTAIYKFLVESGARYSGPLFHCAWLKGWSKLKFWR